MQDSKIIGLLKDLDAREFRLLRKYFRSPFFNYSTAILDLYEDLRKYYPDFDHRALKRQKVFGRLFPGVDYDDKRMRNLLHEFYTHLENFTVQLHLRSNAPAQKKLLIDALAERNLYTDFERKMLALIESVERKPYRDIDIYLELITLYKQYYFHPLTNKLQTGHTSLRAISENLDPFYKANRLLIANEELGINQLIKQPLSTPELPDWEDENQEAPIVRLYYLLYQVNKSGEEVIFEKTKQVFFDCFDVLSFDDQQLITHQLINFTIRMTNRGHLVYYTIGLDLYKRAIQSDLILYNGKITENTFTNIIVYGVKADEMDWVEAFINKYQFYLDSEHRENATLLGLSFLYYAQRKFEQVDELIGDHQFDSVFYQLRSRSILLRALYELFLEEDTYFELLSSRIDAFEKYLRRNQVLSEAQKLSYLGFNKMLRKFSKFEIRQNKRLKAETKLEQEVYASEHLMHRDWFLEQLTGQKSGR